MQTVHMIKWEFLVSTAIFLGTRVMDNMVNWIDSKHISGQLKEMALEGKKQSFCRRV